MVIVIAALHAVIAVVLAVVTVVATLLAVIVVLLLAALVIVVAVVATVAAMAIVLALVVVEADPDLLVTEMGVAGDLLYGDNALVAATGLVKVEIPLVLGAVLLAAVDDQEGLLVAPLVPVLVFDDKTLLLAEPAALLDLSDDLVRVTLRAASVLIKY